MSNGLDDEVIVGKMSDIGNTGWWITCKSDSRFNASGRAYGVFNANRIMNEYIEKKIKELEIDEKNIPQDIEIQAWKD